MKRSACARITYDWWAAPVAGCVTTCPTVYCGVSGTRRFKGQKQLWFLFQLLGDDADVCLSVSHKPEFDQWCWVDYWEPLERIVAFKREVYDMALKELEPLLHDEAG